MERYIDMFRIRYVIYRLSFPDGARYIGRTSDLETRLKQHRYNPSNAGIIERKYLGMDFTHEVLKECHDHYEAIKQEAEVIDAEKSRTKILLNEATPRTKRPSKELRKRMNSAFREEMPQQVQYALAKAAQRFPSNHAILLYGEKGGGKREIARNFMDAFGGVWIERRHFLGARFGWQYTRLPFTIWERDPAIVIIDLEDGCDVGKGRFDLVTEQMYRREVGEKLLTGRGQVKVCMRKRLIIFIWDGVPECHQWRHCWHRIIPLQMKKTRKGRPLDIAGVELMQDMRLAGEYYCSNPVTGGDTERFYWALDDRLSWQRLYGDETDEKPRRLPW